jgi:hypothetical protein
MANAAGHLRTNESACGDSGLQNHQYGIDGSVTGKHGLTLLGDLATIICSYDSTAGYSSNALSSYFHDIGWRDRINNLVRNWLLVGTNDTTQTLGGNYGEATPSDLSFNVTAAKPHASQPPVCPVDKDPWLTIRSNSLSALSAAEMVRRIALHREVPQALQFPGLEWIDIQVRKPPL